MKLLKLEKKTRTLWFVRNAILAGVLLVAYLLISLNVDKQFMIPTFIGLGIPVVLLIVLIMVWPFLKYNCYSYGYDEKRIIIKRGVIFKHHILVPIRQIQDLHLYNGPIMSMLDLSGIILSTAGSNFSIAGMLKEDASKLVEELEERLNIRLDGDPDEEI